MPLQSYCNTDEGLTTLNGDGVATWDCLMQALQDLLLAPEDNVSLPHLIDLRDVQLELESTEMAPFGEFFALRFAKEVTGSIALVVADSLAADDCAKFYQIASSVGHCELFDDYNHAMRWLMKREFAHSPVTQAVNT